MNVCIILFCFVFRSPGGTPLKNKDYARKDLFNPADIIAQALRDKFKKSQMYCNSPGMHIIIFT